ncbi:MAG: copper chaperone [Clostridiales bacterium]|jgi:copper ion binding protein|nr:copper chaperone [Clostridiales bacterium]MDK2934372.1 copper chaperone [Clostridiales bacterium]
MKGMIFVTKKIFIEGMSCGHCVGHVEEALKEICGVKSVAVNLEDKFATVELAHEVDNEKIKAAIDEAGYEVVKIEG